MDSEIKRTMKSAQTGVVRQLKQETRATQLLFVSDLTRSALELDIFKDLIFYYQSKQCKIVQNPQNRNYFDSISNKSEKVPFEVFESVMGTIG